MSQPNSSLEPIGVRTRSASVDLEEHLLSVDQVAIKYGTLINIQEPLHSIGLSSTIINQKLLDDGPNSISPPRQVTPLKLFLSQFLGIFNILLLISASLSIVLFAIEPESTVNMYLGLILFGVVFFNSFIDFFQQYKTNSILESFLSMVPAGSTVIRDQSLRKIPAAELVKGDVILLRAGDKCPADCRLFSVSRMKVDNSSITGESEAMDRNLSFSIENALETTNLVFSGTMVTAGEGYGIVIRTGDNSVLGQIAQMTIGEKTPNSQLTVEISLFVRKISAIAIATALIFFVTSLLLGYDLGITFSFAIGIFVAYVPQGLPLIVSTLLTVAAKRMVRINVLVKNLHAVETLGSITLLATDKTGTLTRNEMTVVGCWINNIYYNLSDGDGYEEDEDEQYLLNDTPNLPSIIQACVLCTKAKFEAVNDKEEPPNASENPKSFINSITRARKEQNLKIFGDATEIGLINFACSYIDPVREQLDFPKIYEIPFSSLTKWHLTIHKYPDDPSSDSPSPHFFSLIKGAPERIAKMCSLIQINDTIVPWTQDWNDHFASAYEHFATKGRRLLAFARQELSQEDYPPDYDFERCRREGDGGGDASPVCMEKFIFMGMVAIMDPPKKGVRKAVAACRTAGIQIVMVTGDHPLTAQAIAKQIGLISGETLMEASRRLQRPIDAVPDQEYEAVVVHGERLGALSEIDWDRILAKREIVFARTSPKQKLEIVTRFQNKGHVVGVSGDGVNDSPALKKADLGISMNKTASDVSKEAASMILLDDNFASIVRGIAEGRMIFANLKKSIRYTLTHIVPEVAAFLLFIALAIPLPFNSLLVLLIDLGTDMAPALSYVFEPAESDLMLVPPRKVLCLQDNQNTESIKMTTVEDVEMGRSLTVKSSKNTSQWQKMKQSLKRPFERKDTGEVLVDGDLIFWSYVQGGVIVWIGALGAYLSVFYHYKVPFGMLIGSAGEYWQENAPPITLTDGSIANDSAQIAISGSAQSAYFLGIVIVQMFNLWITKHRYSYPYGWDMFKNKFTFICALASLSITMIVIYVPGLNNSFLGGGPVPAIAYAIPLAAGVFLFVYEFVRRYLRKRGWFGGVPKKNPNLLDLVRTTSSTMRY